MAGRSRNDPVQVIKTILGMNNAQAPEELEWGEMADLVDVDVTDANHARQRPGFTQVDTEAAHSLGGDDHSAYFVRGDDLYMLADPPVLVRAGVGPTRMTYASVNNAVYYTNGTTRGAAYQEQEVGWGQMPVPTPPTLAATEGNLPPGTYQVSLEALSDTGEKSPPTTVASIVLAEPAGILLTGIVTPPGAQYIRVYITTGDGSQLYMHSVLETPATTATLLDADLKQVMDTYGMVAPPVGQYVAYFRSRLFIADGSVLWYTEPYAFGLVDPTMNFLHFPGTILAVLPAHDGIFVCTTDGVSFLRGMSPTEFVLEDRGRTAMIPGTEARIPHERFGNENTEMTDDVWVWLSIGGFVAGLPDGQVRDLSNGKVDVEAGPEGAGVFEHKNGSSTYRGTIRNPGPDQDSFTFEDRPTIEVYRNGVLLA